MHHIIQGAININNQKLLKLWEWKFNPKFSGMDSFFSALASYVVARSYYYLHQLHPKGSGLKFSLGFLDYVQERMKLQCGLCFTVFSRTIKLTYSENLVFLRNTLLFRRIHLYLVDWPVDRTIPCGQNSFFSRIIHT